MKKYSVLLILVCLIFVMGCVSDGYFQPLNKSDGADSEEDDLYYWFEWGDGTNSGWIGPFASGQTACTNHTWNKKGFYEIRVKAKNYHELQSEWSDPLSVTMPRSRLLFVDILEKFPRLIQLFSYFFGM